MKLTPTMRIKEVMLIKYMDKYDEWHHTQKNNLGIK